MTMELDRRLNECALNLNDGKRLARLSGGDIVSYVLFDALYNSERANLPETEKKDQKESQENKIYPLVF